MKRGLHCLGYPESNANPGEVFTEAFYLQSQSAMVSAEENASIFAFKSISSVEEAEEAIESAEESRDLYNLLFIIVETTRHGGNPEESEEAEEWEASAEAVLDAFYRVAKSGKIAPGTSLTILWKKLYSWIR